MRLNSITTKILTLIICSFLITAIAVIVVADLQLKKIIDRSQSAIYLEKIDTIWNSFERSNSRLQMTGMVEAYSKDFKEAALKEFRQSYYANEGQPIYPFIIDKKGIVVSHPLLPGGDESLKDKELIKQLLSLKNGSINHRGLGGMKWYSFREFSQWGWIIIYTVPLEVKYADARIFRNVLILIIAIVTLFVLITLSFIVASFTRPITRLTDIVTEMAKGKLEQEIELGGKDEIGTLSRSFVRMQEAIKRQLLELRDERNRAANILEGTNAGTWEWNIATNKLTVNEGWAEIRGYALKELLPTTQDTWKALTYDEDLSRVSDLLNRHLKGEVDYFDMEYRQQHKDGHLIWIGSRGKVTMWSDEGEPLLMSGIDMDITQRKLGEEEIYRLRNYLSNIIDSMPSMLMGVDPAGLITQWNREAERKTGIMADDAIGQPLVETVPYLSTEIPRVHEAIKSHSVQSVADQMRKDDNIVLYEDITIYPLISNGIEGAVIRIDDVSKEHELEEQLSHHRKMDAIGQLAGGVAHDFNNTLTGIIGAAQLLKIGGENMSEEQSDFIEIILQSSTRAADLTKKLLAFGRKGKISSAEIDVHKLIRDNITILYRTIDKKINITFEDKALKTVILGDTSSVQNALMNISINASHAMPQGGALCFSTKNTFLNETYCGASPFELTPGEYIEIEIRDNGCGIPLENIHKIFDPFYTTKQHGKGSGLGLAAVYGTVQDHHGAVTVYSEEGVGTVFHLLFPCTDEIVKEEIVCEQLQTGSGLILLVDDENVIRVTGKYLLENMGYEVVTAENGLEAVELFQERHGEIVAVIMDMIMPLMNGREAFYKMKEIDSSCKVIISSGFTQDERIDELTKKGLCGFIHKPYRDFELSRLLAKVLNG